MNEATQNADAKTTPVRISRTFHARRETVFKAWSSAEHVKRWFCPETFTIPQAKVEMRVGGAFDVLMRSPSGEEHWTRGTFVAVVPDERLVIDATVTDAPERRSSAPTPRWISPMRQAARGSTSMQRYTVIDPDAAWMTTGAPEGWRTTLDKLETEVVRMQGGAGSGTRSVVHAMFRIARSYDAPVARVWKALTDDKAKAKWFGGSPGQWELLERHMDVRAGGTERLRGRWEGGTVSTLRRRLSRRRRERAARLFLRHASRRQEDLRVARDDGTRAGGRRDPAFRDGTGRIPRRL